MDVERSREIVIDVVDDFDAGGESRIAVGRGDFGGSNGDGWQRAAIRRVTAAVRQRRCVLGDGSHADVRR